MKKFWTALLCFLLAVSLMLSLCACGSAGSSNDDDDDDGENTTETTQETTEATEPVDPIVGKWEWNLDITEVFNAQMVTSGLGDYVQVKDFYYIFMLELNEDGTAALYIDEEAAQPMLTALKADLKQGVLAYYKALLDAAGITTPVEEYISQAGVDLDATVEQIVSAMEPSALGVDVEGYYKVEDDKLYISESETFTEEDASEFTLDGDKLTINEPYEGLWETMDFERVSE